MASLTYAVDVETGGARSSLAALQTQIAGVGAAAVTAGVALAGAFIIGGSIKTTRELEELRGAFTTVTGDAARSAEEFQRVRDLANALGTDARALGETYVKLAGSGIKPTNAILTTLVDVSKNATDQFGALTAAADLFSRTTAGGLGLEDLNRLQDRGIPVFAILQEQLGLSRLEIAKFGKTAEGALKIQQALYEGFNQRFADTSIRELNSINSQLMVLKNTTDEMQESFGRGLVEAIGAGVGTVGELSGKMNELATVMGQALGGALVFLINNLNIIVPLVGALASAWAAVKLYELAKGIIAMASAFRALTIAMMANPITLIAVAVAALIAGFVLLVQETGSVSNALKTLGNVGIQAINMMVNAYKSFGIFIGHLFVGIGRAIIAGLNPFDNRSAMAELQAGLQRGLAGVQRQMASEGPIRFRFALDPVPTTGRPRINVREGGFQPPTPTGGGGGGDAASRQRANTTREAAERMREQADAARQVTQELIAQNAAANEMRELELSLIGLASEYANLIRANAQARKTAAEEIRALEAKIIEEQAKGQEANAAVIEELKLQIEEKTRQLDVTLRLNQVEQDRTIQLGIQRNILNEQLGIIDHMAQLKGLIDAEDLRNALVLGNISKDQYDRQLSLQQLQTEFDTRREQNERTLADLVARNATVEADALRRQMELESARFELRKGQITIEQQLTERLRQSSRAGMRAAIENAKKITEPFYMAEQATASFFDNMNSALDNFVDTGKFKFADFARSVIADIAKIALKAAATKIFSSIFGSILGVPGLAAGGPAMAGKPYLVGEQGPELFVPNSAGSIMTNASLNKNAGADSGMGATVNNTYITNNISAIDSRSVAQMFVENRKSLLGASVMARKEMPYGS